jgi:two-component system chemotaxis response regulator CheY
MKEGKMQMARIMIVDDTLMMRTMLRRTLEAAGHEIVCEAINGEQAIINYAQFRPDLVTMDITMPGLGGIETIQSIIASDPLANIVVVSSLGQKHIIFSALQSGAKNFVLKPVTEERLLPIINLVLGQAALPQAQYSCK